MTIPFASRFKEKFESRNSSRRSSLAHAQHETEEPQTTTPARVSLENSAFHVSRGGAYARPSSEYSPQQPELGSQHEHARTDYSHDSRIVGDAIPDRRSSQDKPATTEQQIRRKSLPGRNAGQDLVPKRASSKPTHSSAMTGERTVRRVDIAPARQSSRKTAGPNPYFDAVEQQRPAKEMPHTEFGADMEKEMDQIAASVKNLKLPAGWHMNNTVTTHVTETHQAPVTQETIVKQRTEIIQEAISRDIHVHHYYTYMQPVRVVEVLPAKHFTIDPRTGAKVEIQAPAGWTLPAEMTPRIPDTSVIKAWTRHYLVDEEHPRGILETASEKHEPALTNGHNPVRAVRAF